MVTLQRRIAPPITPTAIPAITPGSTLSPLPSAVFEPLSADKLEDWMKGTEQIPGGDGVPRDESDEEDWEEVEEEDWEEVEEVVKEVTVVSKLVEEEVKVVANELVEEEEVPGPAVGVKKDVSDEPLMKTETLVPEKATEKICPAQEQKQDTIIEKWKKYQSWRTWQWCRLPLEWSSNQTKKIERKMKIEKKTKIETKLKRKM